MNIDRGERETMPPAQHHAARLGPNEQYELIEPIGSGAMGTVWRARDLLLDVDVAIKVLRRDCDTPLATRRLLAEARAAAQVRHRSTVRVYAAGMTESARPYIVMELLEGMSLEALLDERGHLPAGDAVRVLLPIVAAASAAHRAGIVHRDIKPSNIFLSLENERGNVRPKLLDFGIAKQRTGRPLSEDLPGDILGTPCYMSPEQAAGSDEIDERTDVWALCAVLYEVLEGEPPFGGDGYNELVKSILTEDPRALDHVDPQLWAIVDRGLCKEPDARWADGSDLGRALASWLLEAGHELDVTHAAVRYSSMFPPQEPSSILPPRSDPPAVIASMEPPSSRRRPRASVQFATTSARHADRLSLAGGVAVGAFMVAGTFVSWQIHSPVVGEKIAETDEAALGMAGELVGARALPPVIIAS